MESILVLGIGNRLMRDDGIGVYVVEALMKGNEDGAIQYVVGETDVDFCLSAIEGAKRLFIVDAAITGEEAGNVTVSVLEDHASVERGISLHNLHLFSTIPLLYPQLDAKVIGIEAHTIDMGVGLSDTLAYQFPSIVQKVQHTIQVLLS